MAYYKLDKNTNSHLLKHSTESEHKPLEVIYDQIIGTEQRKLFEALLIEELNQHLIRVCPSEKMVLLHISPSL